MRARPTKVAGGWYAFRERWMHKGQGSQRQLDLVDATSICQIAPSPTSDDRPFSAVLIQTDPAPADCQHRLELASGQTLLYVGRNRWEVR